MPGAQNQKKKPLKARGCYNCSQRRINCDRSTPTCQKCIKRGLECNGLGTRYRFNNGVASRGKLAGKLIPVRNEDEYPVTPRSNDIPRRSPQASWNCENQHPRHLAPSLKKPDGASVNPQACPGTGGCVSSDDHISTPVSPCAISCYAGPPSTNGTNLIPNPSHSLDHVNQQSRFLLGYFSYMVAPVMVPVDIGFNGYRNFVLPLCDEDEVVRHAVSATAAFHLSLCHDEWKDIASHHHMAAIRRLNQQAAVQTQNDSVAFSNLSAIVILLIGEMITGSNDFQILLRMVKCFIESQGGEEKLETTHLGEFLIQQIRKITLYGEPWISEKSASRTLANLSEKDLGFLYSCFQQHPEHSSTILKLVELITIACNIYVYRVTDVPPEMINNLVRRFIQEYSTFNTTSPGGHVLVWALFVVGAESSTDCDRAFIAAQFQNLWTCTGFANTLSAMRFLNGIWQDGANGRWTRRLNDWAEAFIM